MKTGNKVGDSLKSAKLAVFWLLLPLLTAGCENSKSNNGQSSSSSSGSITPIVKSRECLENMPDVTELLGLSEGVAVKPKFPEAEPSAPVYYFSQSDPDAIDPQLDVFGRGYSIRTTNQWGQRGSRAADYDIDGIQRLKQQGKSVILGLTASVIFEEQFDNRDEFFEHVTKNASGEPVTHFEIVPNAYRGNIAYSGFRDLIVENAKVLIDVGADGIFFDEVNAGYSGNAITNYNGNEGFDAFHEQDFVQYFCNKYPEMTGSRFSDLYNVPEDIALDCKFSPCDTDFSMQAYFEHHGGYSNTLPLMSEWGLSVANKIPVRPDNFVDTYNVIYWFDIVSRVRRYAREQNGKDILITSNGLFPFVDFQSVGLYPWNSFGPGGGNPYYTDFVPTTNDGQLDASYSFGQQFRSMREHSDSYTSGVPVVLFLDWPTEMISKYYQFSEQQKKDYFRIYAAEAYASGLRFAWHLKTSLPNDPTASDHNMLEWFRREATFYENNEFLFQQASPGLTSSVTASHEQVYATIQVLPDNSHVVHLVNHQYSNGQLQTISNLNVSVGGLIASGSGTAYSPDQENSSPIALTSDGTDLSFTLPILESYTVIHITPSNNP